MCKVYGYCRISRKTQSIERQERNIRSEFPDAIIFKEAATGTKDDAKTRPIWNKLLKVVKSGDTIVFDSVSRMSRNAEDGIRAYFTLFDKGVSLVFLKERHIDTTAYKEALGKCGFSIELNDGTAESTMILSIMDAVTEFMRTKAADDIRKAFDQADKEVSDIHQRTKEGIETARLNGKQIGSVKGQTYVTKKSIEVKTKIKKMSKDFDGNMSDVEVIETLRISRNTYYKYKAELKAE